MYMNGNNWEEITNENGVKVKRRQRADGTYEFSIFSKLKVFVWALIACNTKNQYLKETAMKKIGK